MSQQRPAPNPILTVLMWGAFFFLGYQLFFANRAPNDARTSEEVYAKLVELNKAHNAGPIVQESNIYRSKLDADEEAGRIKPDEKEWKLFEAEVVKTHTLFAAGEKANNRGQLDAAYQSFKGLYERYHRTDFWTRGVKVEPYGDVLPQSMVTGSELYDALVKELGERNKTATLVGYIPGYGLMDTLVKLTGAVPGFSYWFAALLLAICVRVLVFPLAQKQYMWGKRMGQLAPYIKEIQEKFKDKKTGKVTDQQAMTMETMDLYKKYGFNPFAGCWPMLIQIPLFLLIYQCMLLYRFEFTKGYFLWIQPGAGSFLGIPLAPNLGERDYLMIGLYGVSMLVTTLLTPVSDPANVRQQRIIGISFALLFSVMMFFWPLPSAFVVYWVFTNVLATAQSLYVYRMPVEPLVPVQSTAGGVIPTTGKDMNGKTNVDPGFFGKTGKGSSKKKKKR
jgi:YidC/Oxa1 family membrane protein insertase